MQILYARDVDQRSTTFEKSLLMGKEFQRRAKAMILRAAVLRNQIHVKVSGLGVLGSGQQVNSPCLNPSLSTAVASQRREPGRANTSEQPVPYEHQHVRGAYLSLPRGHGTQAACPGHLKKRLHAACGHWTPALPPPCPILGCGKAGRTPTMAMWE